MKKDEYFQKRMIKKEEYLQFLRSADISNDSKTCRCCIEKVAIGENIKRIRIQCGLTQMELALLIGISELMEKKYELGLSVPRKRRLKAIAEALGVDVELLKKPCDNMS